MSSANDLNYEWFKTNLPDLLMKHRGKYLIVCEESIQGAYPTFDEALDAALEVAKPGDFLVQHCVTEEESAQVICSLMRLPISGQNSLVV